MISTPTSSIGEIRGRLSILDSWNLINLGLEEKRDWQSVFGLASPNHRTCIVISFTVYLKLHIAGFEEGCLIIKISYFQCLGSCQCFLAFMVNVGVML